MRRYLLNTAFIVCLMGHTAVQTSVAQGFLAAQAALFRVLVPIETSRNVNLYNASPMSFSTFVHDLMNLQAPEGQSVPLCDRPATGHRDVVFLQRPARLGEVLTVFAQRHGLVAGSPTLEESYLSKKGDDPRTDQAFKGADSELPGWQPKEKEA